MYASFVQEPGKTEKAIVCLGKTLGFHVFDQRHLKINASDASLELNEDCDLYDSKTIT